MILQKAYLLYISEGRELLWGVFAGSRVQRKDYRSYLPHFHDRMWARVLTDDGECSEFL